MDDSSTNECFSSGDQIVFLLFIWSLKELKVVTNCKLTIDALSFLSDSNIFSNKDETQRWLVGDTLSIANDAHIEPYVAIMRGTQISTIGSFSYSWSVLHPLVEIGRYCSISWGMTVMGVNHPMERFTTSSVTYDRDLVISFKPLKDHPESSFKQKGDPKGDMNRRKVIIGNDVWIGQNVTFARGVKVGDGSIIASNSTVTKDVEPYSIVGGVPAKLIRKRFNEIEIQRLLDLKPWSYAFWNMDNIDLDIPITNFLEILLKLHPPLKL